MISMNMAPATSSASPRETFPGACDVIERVRSVNW
jgi:hypothetical protein